MALAVTERPMGQNGKHCNVPMDQCLNIYTLLPWWLRE